MVCTKSFDGKRSKGKGEKIAGGLEHPFMKKDFENLSPQNGYWDYF